MVTPLLRSLAERQAGVIGRAQLLSAGVSAGSIAKLVASGRLIPIHPGVYAYAHANLSLEGRLRAALLHAGARSGLTGWAGAHWYGLSSRVPARIEVVTAGRVRSRRGLIVHRTGRPEIAIHRGLRIATVPRVLLQVAANRAPHSELRRMLAEVEYRRLATLEQVAEAAGQGRRGSTALLAAVAAHQPLLARTRSGGERALIPLIEAAGLPLPQVNVKIGRMTVDALWPEHKLIVEIDGGDGHSSRAQMTKDRKRDLHLRSLGFTVIRYAATQIRDQPDLVIADLTRALAATIAPSTASIERATRRAA